jgi:hypothetical protein
LGKWFLITNKLKFSKKNSSAHYPFCKDLWPQKIGDFIFIHCMPFLCMLFFQWTF